MANKNVNNVTAEIMRLAYQNTFEAFEKTLTGHDVSRRAYTIMGERDDSLCMICDEGVWKVFHSERGTRFDTRDFENVTDACLYIIHRLSASGEKELEMMSSFLRELQKTQNTALSPKAVFDAVQNAMAS